MPHPDGYRDVIDLFIFRNDQSNSISGQGQYSMYVVSTNGIIMYDGIGEGGPGGPAHKSISPELFQNQNYALTKCSSDCNDRGQIVFDAKNNEGQHFIKCYHKARQEERYDYQHQFVGNKKQIKFFNQYVIEVRTEKSEDKIQIYDFENKYSLFSAKY